MSITQRRGAMLHGRYRVLKPLGQGGMGAVYLAEDRRLPGRKVALKENQNTLPDAQSQFKREAVMLARLRHPNLPAVTDYFIESSGRQFLVMDYVPGENLKQRLQQQGPMPEADALACMHDILAALHYMHTWQDPESGRSTSIIHRDIKPANIKQTAAGQYILVDFGIAKYAGGAGTVVSARALTPGYAPIEQYHGGTDQRSDIYALGATLFSLVSGHTPPSSTSMATGAPLPPLQTFKVRASKDVETAIKKAMAVQPNDRFQSADEMYRSLFHAPLTTAGGARGTTEPRTAVLASVGASVGATTARIRRDVRRRPVRAAALFLAALLLLLSIWRLLAGVQSPEDEIGAATLTTELASSAGQVVVATGTPTAEVVAFSSTDAATETPSEEADPFAVVDPDADSGGARITAGDEDGAQPGVDELAVETVKIESQGEVEADSSSAGPDDDVQEEKPTAVVGTPTRPPTSTPLPTSTRLSTRTPTRTPTRAATATATRKPVVTARPQPTSTVSTGQPSPPAQDASIAAPVLVSPGEGQHHTHSRLTFQWRWTGELQPNWGFEVRGWYPSGPHNGIHDARSTTGIRPDGNGVYSQNLKIPGQYSQGVWHWTVAIVQLEPYVRIGPEASPRKLSVDTATATPTPVLSGGGGSSGSGDGR